ncbi:MAG: YecA family protein [Steroidobacter sp.]
MLNVTFAEINAELRSIEPQLDAAEAHGCLCGVLCTVKNLSVEHWLQEILATEGDDQPIEAFDLQSLPASPALEQLFGETRQTLHDDAMEFMLLLPDDDLPLMVRVAAMAQWVAGFLYGFGTGAIHMNEFPEPVSEALQDFTQIARANPDEVVESEEDENAYTELVEYLRAAVQVIYDELAPWRISQISTSSSPDLLN